MSNYTKTTNFTAKDSLPSGNANKKINGSLFDTEFDALATAVNSKANSATPTFTGVVTSAGNVVVDDTTASTSGTTGSIQTDGGIGAAKDIVTDATFKPLGDTAASDAAAIGHTAAEGLILTGQGSANDVTIKNDAAQTVARVQTGTQNLTFEAGIHLGGTGSANLLDDYEEGTFSPTYVPATNSFSSITYDAQDGYYTKVGEAVHVGLFIRTDALTVGTASGDLSVGGLPFTASDARSSVSVSLSQEFTGKWPNGGQVSGATILLYAVLTTADSSIVQVSNMKTAANDNGLVCSATYRA